MAAVAPKSSKKRSAPSQKGPATKKIHLDSTQKKKRSQPVTRPAPGSDDTGSDSDEIDGQTDDFFEGDGDAMEVDEAQKPIKDALGAYSPTHKLVFSTDISS